jgi:hypothetical protein
MIRSFITGITRYYCDYVMGRKRRGVFTMSEIGKKPLKVMANVK